MNFQDAVKTCLTEKYATFAGRASRSEYWWFFLAYVLVAIAASLLGWIIEAIVILALIVPMAAAGFRRLQDTGRPGWYILIPMGLSLVFTFMMPTMPVMGTDGMPMGDLPSAGGLATAGILGLIQFVVALLFLWWLTRPSQPGPNEYGPNPHEVTQ